MNECITVYTPWFQFVLNVNLRNTYLVPKFNVLGLQPEVVLSDFILGIPLHLGHSQTRSQQAKQGNVATIALARDKVPLDLLLCGKSVNIAEVMRHEVLLALAASHVHADNGLGPRDGVAQLPLAN